MNKNGELNALLDALELIATEWEENCRPEDIRLSEQKVTFLLTVSSLVKDRGGNLTAALVRARAPTFASQYQQVLLREL